MGFAVGATTAPANSATAQPLIIPCSHPRPTCPNSRRPALETASVLKQAPEGGLHVRLILLVSVAATLAVTATACSGETDPSPATGGSSGTSTGGTSSGGTSSG